jgi:uncharacterized membrane protein
MTYLHMVSSIGVFGTILFIRFVSTPIMRYLEPKDDHAVPLLIEASQKLLPMVWSFLGVCIATGTAVTFMHLKFGGLFHFDLTDMWNSFIMLKHVLFVVYFLSLVRYTMAVRANKKKLDASGWHWGNTVEFRSLGEQLDGSALLCVISSALVLFSTSAAANDTGNWIYFALHCLHVLMIAAWIGGLFFVIFVGTPLVSRCVAEGKMNRLEGAGHMQMVSHRFIKVLWLSMFVTIFTGFPMLFLSPSYAGFMKSYEPLQVVMLIKVILFVIMILGAFRVTPAILRLKWLLEINKDYTKLTKETVDDINVQRTAMGHNSRYGFWFGMVVFFVVAIILVLKG